MSGDPTRSPLPKICLGAAMFEPASHPRLFGLPPGVDFPRTLVAGLRARLSAAPPEAMARVTLYLNTTRMRDRVRAAFQEAGPGFLPRLRLVTDLGTGGTPIPPLRRQLELARLVGELTARQQDFAPGTATFDLAGRLGELLDEMQSEGVSPEALEHPDLAENHAVHWERSLAFLRIIAPFFAPDAAGSAAGLQRRAAEKLAASWLADPPKDPVIVAGSTGSRGTTSLLMQAVATLPQGAIVLPGFDADMTAPAWASLTAGQVPDEDHPQYRYAGLLRRLDRQPRDVADWHAVPPVDRARNGLMSLALRPAPVTDQWLAEGRTVGAVAKATTGLSLIEAPSPRAEANAIALILRTAAEDGDSAVLMTPDRNLARRVTAALDRWGLLPDDSAGRPLHLSAPGRLIRHICALFGRVLTAEALLTILKHPLCATGAPDRGRHLLWTRELELHLRRHGPPFPKAADLLGWAEKRDDAACVAWVKWIGTWCEAGLSLAFGPVSAFSETLSALLDQVASGPDGHAADSELWQEEAGAQAFAVLAALRTEAVHGAPCAAGDFSALVAGLLQKEVVRSVSGSHPLIAIHGTREARELQADLVILGGLNDGVWPAAPAPDPWLSRQMRLKVGLTLPERQIGLAAHDFQIAACAAPRVVLSRALRDDEAETVPSRWLDRLTNLIAGLGEEAGALADMRARGRHWLHLAETMEQPGVEPPAPRPAPRPPVDARPRELPVTAITRLIRDPYAVYARHILRLKRLDPLLPEPDARIRGQALHRIVEAFVRQRPEEESEQAAAERLLAITETVLAEEIPWPSAQRFWRARIERIAARFVQAEARRAAQGVPVLLEEEGRITLSASGFTLKARPDRIDQAEDGSLHIFDYKSGTPPSKSQRAAFEKQMPLEAAMAERGAFARLGPQPVSGVTFIQLGGEGAEVTTPRADLDLDAEWAALERLIGQYMRRTQGYAARRAVFKTDETGDYDHLSRFGEWQMSDPSEPQDVGGRDDG